MSLAQALDTVAEQHFSDMSSRTVRDALKEISKVSNDSTITKSIANLSQQQQDVLMKVVYVGMSSDPSNSSVYLKWHALLFETAGTGSIVRVLTDKSNPVPQPKGP